MSERVAGRYAQALLEIAEEHHAIDTFESQLTLVSRTLAENEQLRRVFLHPQVDKAEKKTVVDKIFGEHVSQEILNLLKLLIDRKRESMIDDVLEAYTKSANDIRGILDVSVTTAAPLDESERKSLSERLERSLNKKLRMHTDVDRKIIGGLMLKIGNRLYDGTVRTKLEGFRHEIKAGK